mgnify:CR=1 FL=1
MGKMKSVNINGNIYNLHKNLQDFVKYTLQKLLETNSLSEEEIKNLEDKEYCKDTFNLNYPLLSRDRFAYAEDKNHPRYYAKSGFFVQGYYLCNHWFEDNEDFFSKWLMEISK